MSLSYVNKIAFFLRGTNFFFKLNLCWKLHALHRSPSPYLLFGGGVPWTSGHTHIAERQGATKEKEKNCDVPECQSHSHRSPNLRSATFLARSSKLVTIRLSWWVRCHRRTYRAAMCLATALAETSNVDINNEPGWFRGRAEMVGKLQVVSLQKSYIPCDASHN